MDFYSSIYATKTGYIITLKLSKGKLLELTTIEGKYGVMANFLGCIKFVWDGLFLIGG